MKRSQNSPAPELTLKIPSQLRRAVTEMLRTVSPPPKLTISEWADRYRRLSSESSAEPGQWMTRRAEYQRGIMNAISEPGVERVVLMTSAQVGKTEIVNNVVGFMSRRTRPRFWFCSRRQS